MSDGNLERTALKEWAVLVDAMARGDIVAMVRKGGIREQRAGFQVRHDRFLLYPTYFHEKAAEVAPRLVGGLEPSHARRPAEGRLRLEYVAAVAGVWPVSDESLLPAIAHEHGLAPAAVTSRFHYKNRPGVQVVAVRVARLPEPVEIAESRRYTGCVSWVELDAPLDVAGATPLISDSEYEPRLAAPFDSSRSPNYGFFVVVVVVVVVVLSCFIAVSEPIFMPVSDIAGAGAGAMVAAESVTVVSVFVSLVVQAAMLRTAAARARRFIRSPWEGR